MRRLLVLAVALLSGCGYSCDAQEVYRQARISSRAVVKVWVEQDAEGTPTFYARCASGEVVNWSPYDYEGYQDQKEAVAAQLLEDCLRGGPD